MVAKNPKVAWLRDCIVWGIGDIIGIGQTLTDARIKQLRQLIGIEAKQFTIEPALLESVDLDRQ